MTDAAFFVVVWFGAIAICAMLYAILEIGGAWRARRRSHRRYGGDVRSVLIDLAAHDREWRARLRRLR